MAGSGGSGPKKMRPKMRCKAPGRSLSTANRRSGSGRRTIILTAVTISSANDESDSNRTSASVQAHSAAAAIAAASRPFALPL